MDFLCKKCGHSYDAWRLSIVVAVAAENMRFYKTHIATQEKNNMGENMKKINAVVETNKNNFKKCIESKKINFKNYSNPEIAAHIANIFVFPQKAPLYTS